MDLISTKINIVPGVVGPRELTGIPIAVPTADGVIEFVCRVAYDDELRRYVIRELTATATSGHGITAPMLRSLKLSGISDDDTGNRLHAVTLALLATPTPHIEELPKPADHDGPWGLRPPADVSEAPTSRALAWVRHLYAYAVAVELPPTKTVAEILDLKPATAGRWVDKALPKAGQGKVREV
jgi:hypothetical protein